MEITDNSFAHINHVGSKQGGHFIVTIQSPSFNGLTSIKRHRLIYQVLKPLLNNGIHALQIIAKDSHNG